MHIERRKYVRFLTLDNTFAAIRREFKKVGKINDISERGLAFSYLSKTDEANADCDSSEIDIFLSGNEFHLSNVPCKLVYDIPASSLDEGFFVKMRQCGLYFGELTKSQLDQLNIFMKSFTKGILSS